MIVIAGEVEEPHSEPQRCGPGSLPVQSAQTGTSSDGVCASGQRFSHADVPVFVCLR